MAYCHNNIQNDRSLMSHDALLQYYLDNNIDVYLDDCESRSPQTIQTIQTIDVVVAAHTSCWYVRVRSPHVKG